MDQTILNELSSPTTIQKVIHTLLFIFIVLLLRFIITRRAWKKAEQIQSKLLIRRISNILSILIIIIATIPLWIEDFKQIGTFLGLLSAGIAVSLKDILVDLLGRLVIDFRRLFVISDRIQIGEYSGDVIDISFLQTTILEIGNWVEEDQSTGRIINIPNRKVFEVGVANYTKGFGYIWNEMKILLTFESNWEKAKELILKMADEINKSSQDDIKAQMDIAYQDYLIKYTKLTPIIYTSVKDSGIELTLRYLCKVRERRTIECFLWEKILMLTKQDTTIILAYPTERLINN